MEQGFMFDGERTNGRWCPGKPPRGIKNVLTWDPSIGAYRTVTFRCPKCGLLDSYAIDPVKK